jgi:hypothetical protein
MLACLDTAPTCVPLFFSNIPAPSAFLGNEKNLKFVAFRIFANTLVIVYIVKGCPGLLGLLTSTLIGFFKHTLKLFSTLCRDKDPIPVTMDYYYITMKKPSTSSQAVGFSSYLFAPEAHSPTQIATVDLDCGLPTLRSGPRD